MFTLTVNVTDTPATDQGQWRMIATVQGDAALTLSRPVERAVWSVQAAQLVEALAHAYTALMYPTNTPSLMLDVDRTNVTDDGTLTYQVRGYL